MPSNNPLEHLLADVAETLDVPASAYDQAEERYRAVGEWLCADASPIRGDSPEVYSQGSFRLGTVVRPLRGDDYDLDAVVQLAGSQASWMPGDLKAAVGERLRAHSVYGRMLEPEGRRCWTLQYASEPNRHRFHLDLLPSILSNPGGVPRESSPTALAITNRVSPGQVEWRHSDPKGYADWFLARTVTLSEKRAAHSGTVAGVEPVRTFTRHAPLQRAVQLLKRYRDVLFRDDDEHAPISVIITTLAAQAYEGEEALVDTLFGVLNRMSRFIRIQGDEVVIPNPIQPNENFADRWHGDVRKAKAFVKWLESAKRLEAELLAEPPDRLSTTLGRVLGESSGRAAMEKFAARGGRPVARQLVETSEFSRSKSDDSKTGTGLRGALSAVLALLLNAPHRQRPPWQMAPDGTTVKVRGFVTGGRGARLGEFVSGQPLSLFASLRFDADIIGSHTEVYWQVTNTGEEAARAQDLRGRLELGRRQKTETARYRGDHSIECFVVREGVCVARSGQFVVSVRG